MALAAHPTQESQSASAVMMVRPACFGFNPQTAGTNAFQRPASPPAVAEVQERVLGEFESVAAALQRAGVEVLIVPDTPQPVKPDAIFPNNWVSFHVDGTVVLYPMLAPNRRPERREEILEQVVRRGRFRVTRTVDLTHREAQGKFLEGTGSLVLDRTHRVAYAALSPRTDLDALGEFAQLLDYDLVAFEAQGIGAQPVYHTNVVMSIGARFAVVCGEAITQPGHRDAVFNSLKATGHAVVDITRQQMFEFAANLLELAPAGGPCIALSTSALRTLGSAQRRVLESHAELIPVNIPTIESRGGGGVRCMLAELHLPKRLSE